MPLESLRQPFDPEQAGHKLREVHTEQEAPEKESKAREQFEHVKSLYYENGNWNSTPDIRNERTILTPRESAAKLLALLEWEMKIPREQSTMSPELWQKMLEPESVENDWFGALPWVGRNPEKAQDLWKKLLTHNSYIFDEYSGLMVESDVTLDRQNEGRAIYGTIELLFEWQLLEPEKARQAAKIFFEHYPFEKLEGLIEWYPMDLEHAPLRFVLLEAYCEKEEARKHLEKLRQVGNFDQTRGLWGKEWPSLAPQFLGILAELQIEKNEARKAQQNLPSQTKLPEERNF